VRERLSRIYRNSFMYADSATRAKGLALRKLLGASMAGLLLILVSMALGLAIPDPAQGQSQPKDTSILKGSPLGGVKFEHKLHVERAGNKCDGCHHASKPEKPLKAEQERCQDCHTKPAQPGMKTTAQAAFHDAAAKSGNCIDCHRTENAAGKKAPMKCPECHKKSNV